MPANLLRPTIFLEPPFVAVKETGFIHFVMAVLREKLVVTMDLFALLVIAGVAGPAPAGAFGSRDADDGGENLGCEMRETVDCERLWSGGLDRIPFILRRRECLGLVGAFWMLLHVLSCRPSSTDHT